MINFSSKNLVRQTLKKDSRKRTWIGPPNYTYVEVQGRTPTAKSDNFVAKYINYRVVPLPKFLAGHPPHACVPKFTQTTFGISTNNIFVSSYDFSIYHLTKY